MKREKRGSDRIGSGDGCVCAGDKLINEPPDDADATDKGDAHALKKHALVVRTGTQRE